MKRNGYDYGELQRMIVRTAKKWPHLTATDIAGLLGCHPAYVRAVKRRLNLSIPRATNYPDRISLK